MIAFLIALGIGFSPGSVNWMPTLGFSIGVPVDSLKYIIAYGIGFSPGSTKWMPTYGFSAAVVVPSTGTGGNNQMNAGVSVGL